ncbi:hypothetical protein [Micromonospora arborensis]
MVVLDVARTGDDRDPGQTGQSLLKDGEQQSASMIDTTSPT